MHLTLVMIAQSFFMTRHRLAHWTDIAGMINRMPWFPILFPGSYFPIFSRAEHKPLG